jgi:hypothetical protein
MVTGLTARNVDHFKVEKLYLGANQLVFYTYVVNSTFGLKEIPVTSQPLVSE